MTTGRDRSPFAATAPAVMTDASLGTTGSSASRRANATRMRYAQPDASATSWLNCANTPDAIEGLSVDERPLDVRSGRGDCLSGDHHDGGRVPRRTPAPQQVSLERR